MKKKEIKKFCKENEVELFNKLNIKFGDGVFYNDGMGVFGVEGNSERGIDVSLIEGVLIGDDYNKINKIEIGDKVLFVNDYR
jgi:hypothetical protein